MIQIVEIRGGRSVVWIPSGTQADSGSAVFKWLPWLLLSSSSQVMEDGERGGGYLGGLMCSLDVARIPPVPIGENMAAPGMTGKPGGKWVVSHAPSNLGNRG